ncbi:ribonuclease H-like domain-containing protein, partial [Cytidiella melzeri]
ASAQSHTGDHLSEEIIKVLNAIGPLLFRGIMSDNTGNTRLARAIVSKTFPWVMNLIDAPHHFQLMLKDIGGLHYFKEIIECCRQTIRFFRKSSYANAHLREKRKDLKIKTGLTSFGKTRFSTVYLSGCSLRTNMPAIKALCNANTVNLKVRAYHDRFVDGFANTTFCAKLDELLLILAPGAKSTMCLESTNSTVSDVYVFWLATLAELHDIITDRHNPMPNEVREDIRRIANFRWKGMIEQSPTADVYHAGFILDP